MNALPRTVFSLFVAASLTSARAELTVHEWGTFTAVHASDGTLLSGLEREEHRLPNFVRSHAGFSPADKGWNRPVKNVTIKMETPVLYFYAKEETPVEVDVGFKGGSISQWYPERSGGEELSPLPANITDIMQLRTMTPVDFGKGFEGSIQWRVMVLASGSTEKINAPAAWETPQWSRARVPDANWVKGPPGFVETARPDGAATAPVVEGFLFYRGLGNFALPLQIVSDDSGRITVKNRGAETIPYLLAYERTVDGRVLTFELSRLPPGERRVLPSGMDFKNRFHAALTQAGLTAAEASAMLATWKESYFDAPGLRVFWIVPRAFTDRILPLTITPVPDKLERVLVGRSEVLTPAFERELVEGFRKDGGARWTNDRYFLAYRERARQLGVVLPENTP